MKNLKIILTIFMALIIIVFGFATEALALMDITVLNPFFYTAGLRGLGFYESLRDLVLEQINEQINMKDSIPQDFKDDVYAVVENVFPKKEFSKQLGDFFGGTIKFVLYGKGDGIIPLNEWIGGLEQGVKSSGIAKEIVDEEIKNNNIDENDKDYYYGEYERAIVSTTTRFFGNAPLLTAETSNFSEVFYNTLAPTEKVKNNIDDNLWVIRFWVKRAIISFFVGLAIVLLFIALLFLVWREKKQKVFKFFRIMLMINFIGLLLVGVLMFFAVSIANFLNIIPAFLISYSSILQAAVNSMAFIVLGIAFISLMLFIIVFLIGRKTETKAAENNEKETTSIPESEISEINYIEETKE